MIIDTHCHYNCEPLLSQIDSVWKDSLDRTVAGGICIGTDLENSKIALELAQKFPSMFAAIGIHPEESIERINILLSGDTYSQAEVDTYVLEMSSGFEQLLQTALSAKNKKIIAVGEIGLDYYRLKVKGLKRQLAQEVQKQIFSFQLEQAFQQNVPVILHVRDQSNRTDVNAYYDTLTIVSDLVQNYQSENKKIPTLILHCASGPKDYIVKFLQLGAYVGFAGNVTYDNATDLREILALTPKDKILLETDAPFLAPLDKKGEVCQPHFITETAQFLQDTYQIDLAIILSNTLTVFPEFQKVVE